jgi:hypothetical protein
MNSDLLDETPESWYDLSPHNVNVRSALLSVLRIHYHCGLCDRQTDRQADVEFY